MNRLNLSKIINFESNESDLDLSLFSSDDLNNDYLTPFKSPSIINPFQSPKKMKIRSILKKREHKAFFQDNNKELGPENTFNFKHSLKLKGTTILFVF